MNDKINDEIVRRFKAFMTETSFAKVKSESSDKIKHYITITDVIDNKACVEHMDFDVNMISVPVDQSKLFIAINKHYYMAKFMCSSGSADVFFGCKSKNGKTCRLRIYDENGEYYQIVLEALFLEHISKTLDVILKGLGIKSLSHAGHIYHDLKIKYLPGHPNYKEETK